MAVEFGFDYSHMMSANIGPAYGVNEADLDALEPAVARAAAEIAADIETGPDQANYGFWYLPDQSSELLGRMTELAARTAELADAHLILGIGGSYLGARMLFEALCHRYHNELPAAARRHRPRIYFEGNGLDTRSLHDLLERLADEPVTIEVVSKSGGTIETLTAFRLLRERLADRVRSWVVTTDPGSPLEGYCRRLGLTGLELLPHPLNVGGRYSVLSPVGLFPAAVCGLDIQRILAGAAEMRDRCRATELRGNPAYLYAALQYLSLLRGRHISIMAAWDRRLEAFGLWYDQLCAESLGKNERGRTPLTAVCTRELHSRGQQHQQGTRDKVITNLVVAQADRSDLRVPVTAPDEPSRGSEFLDGRSLSELNDAAYRATDTAYATDQRPGMTIAIGRLDEEHLGALVFLFELATIVEGKLMGVNPIDQPGVKAYKDFLGGLLGQPGFEVYRARYERWLRGRKDYRL